MSQRFNHRPASSNFPLPLSTRKIGWALAAGNCVVLKPSDYTPVIAIKLAEVLHDSLWRR